MSDDKKCPDISDETFTTRMLYKMIRSKFPKVNQLSTDILRTWLVGIDTKDTILLVDVRENNEFEISRLNNCFHVLPDNDLGELVDKVKSSCVKKVVAYCSVGYRSSSLIQKLYGELKRNDFDPDSIELYNLEGSIFKWANEGHPIVDSSGAETTYVHPYNTIWGKFLEAERRKYPE